MNAIDVRLAVDVNFRNLALGHEVVESPTAVFVRDRSLPLVYDANFAFDIRASTPDEIESLLVEAHRYFAGAARLTFQCDPFTPPQFEARLALEGFERNDALIMRLDGALPAIKREVVIREIASDAGWDDYARLKGLDWLEHAARLKLESDPQVGADLALSGRSKSPPVSYLLAYLDDVAVGFCQFWEGLEGCGQVEDLFVEAGSRHRGIATALLHAGVAGARARGAGPVVILADPSDTPKQMYAALGWVPLAVCRQYGKQLSTVLKTT